MLQPTYFVTKKRNNFRHSSSLLADKLILCMPKRRVFHLLKGFANHIALFAILICSWPGFVFFTVSLSLYCFCRNIIGQPFQFFGESLKHLK